jgi:hypothetical protein
VQILDAIFRVSERWFVILEFVDVATLIGNDSLGRVIRMTTGTQVTLTRILLADGISLTLHSNLPSAFEFGKRPLSTRMKEKEEKKKKESGNQKGLHHSGGWPVGCVGNAPTCLRDSRVQGSDEQFLFLKVKKGGEKWIVPYKHRHAWYIPSQIFVLLSSIVTVI